MIRPGLLVSYGAGEVSPAATGVHQSRVRESRSNPPVTDNPDRADEVGDSSHSGPKDGNFGRAGEDDPRGKGAAGAGAGAVKAWLSGIRPRRKDLKADVLAGLPGAISSVPDGM